MEFKKDIKNELALGPLAFVLLTCSISWTLWLITAVSAENVFTCPYIFLALLGVYTPMIISVVITKHSKDRNDLKELWDRGFNFKRIGKRGYAFIFLSAPVICAISIAIDYCIGNSLQQSEVASEFLTYPVKLIPYAVLLMIISPIPEEFGWRSYFLDTLQARYSQQLSSIIVGFVWLIWMLPLFFIKGLMHHDVIGFGTNSFWLFCIFIIAISVIYSWIYNNNDRSILALVLFHFMFNFTGNIIPLSQTADMNRTLLVVAYAIVILTGLIKIFDKEENE